MGGASRAAARQGRPLLPQVSNPCLHIYHGGSNQILERERGRDGEGDELTPWPPSGGGASRRQSCVWGRGGRQRGVAGGAGTTPEWRCSKPQPWLMVNQENGGGAQPLFRVRERYVGREKGANPCRCRPAPGAAPDRGSPPRRGRSPGGWDRDSPCHERNSWMIRCWAILDLCANLTYKQKKHQNVYNNSTTSLML